MSVDFLAEINLSEPTFAKGIAGDGVPAASLTLATSTHADIYWRWADEVTAQPHYLGTVAAGKNFSTPFPDLAGRSVQVFVVSKTAAGVPNVRVITEGTTKIFTFGVAEITSLTYSAPTVTGNIANNGGTGNIHVMRSSDGVNYTEITSVAYTATSFTDTPDAGATYHYKLIQDGFKDASTPVQVTLPLAGSNAPPTFTSATFSTPNVNLVFAKNGTATGDIRIYRKGTTGDYSQIANVAHGSTSYSDTSITVDDTYTYKLSQDGITGYSVEKSAVVSGISGGSGSPPSDLNADTDVINNDEVDVNLSWTDHGATGSVIVERRQGGGLFITVDTLAAGTTFDTIAETRSGSNYTVDYRVRNTSVAGETNIVTVTILRQFF